MINPRYLYLADDPILLNENVPNNGKSETGLFQAHAGVKIVNRDNIPHRLGLKMQSKYRDIDSRIFIALSDPQVVGGIIKGNKNENNGNDRDKKRALIHAPARCV